MSAEGHPGGAAPTGTAAERGVRTLVARVPDWPVVAAGHGDDEPVLVVRANRVVAASTAARAVGATVGLRRREAQGRCPDAVLVADDPARDARTFEPLVAALTDIAPRVAVTRPGTVALGTRGPSRYHGGDAALAARVAEVLAAGSRQLGSDPGSRGSVPVPVRVGVADGAFAAHCASLPGPPGRSLGPGGRIADPEEVAAGIGTVRVVPVGSSSSFLAPWPVSTAAAHLDVDEADEVAAVLGRLGLPTLAGVAALDPGDVLGRFGEVGSWLHRLARGLDPRPLVPRSPAPERVVVAEIDPPLDRVDSLAFRAVTLADTLHTGLRRDGLACLRIGIEVETEHGERRRRSWRHEGGLTAAAVAERTRWQLDGWLSGPVSDRPTAGVIRLVLDPEEVVPARGRQLGFWGGETRLDEGAARALTRVAALLGTDAVTVPVVVGGRGPAERIVTVPAASVDLTGDRTVVRPGAEGPWPGRLPAPSPARVHPDPVPVDLHDADGRPVGVSGRGMISAPPARLGRRPVTGWAGPWPVDERWWDPDRARRRARVQVVLDDGTAHLLALEEGSWRLEATYD